MISRSNALQKLAALALLPLLTATAAGAERPTDLAEASRRIRAIAETKGTESESARLARFFELFWDARMLAFPGLAPVVGYPGLEDRWADRSPEAIALLHRITREEQAALASIDRSRLCAAEQLTYDLARRRLEVRIEGERFHDLEPFYNQYLVIDQLNGIDLGIQDLQGYISARTVADYELALRMLRGFPAAAEQTLTQLGEGLAAGITPPRVTLQGVPERVGSLLADDPWKSPVLQPFRDIPDSVPAAERERLRREAERIYAGEVAPVVRRLRDFLADRYVPGARESIAMRDQPDGPAWYAYNLRTHTTTDLTPDEIHKLGLAEVRRIRGEMDAVIAATGFEGSYAEFCRFLRTDPRFFYDRAEDLVAGFRDITKRIDPGLIKLFGRLPRLPYGVKAMDGEAAKTAPAAYYNSGTLAGGVPGWFLVNTYALDSRPKWGMEALALHETVPGHHLQYALVEELGELPDWRKWDVYPAFSEGWALYAESLGEDLGLYQDPYSKFGQLTNEIWRAIRLVVDPGIHLMGWTRQQAIDYYLASSAKPQLEVEREVDRIIAHPGTVPVYKVGELKFQELRRYAERELGPAFDLRAFHDHLLGRGQLPLDLLQESVEAWVAETKAARAP